MSAAPTHLLAVICGLPVVLALAGCDNECDFFERCAGDVREVCGDGADQSFGRRIRRHPCEAPNAVCVERDRQNAACVLPGEVTCGDDTPPRCDGAVVVSCQGVVGYTEASAEPPRYLVGADCAADGRSCATTESGAACTADGETGATGAGGGA